MIAVNKASSFNGHVRRREGVCDTPLHIYRLFVRDSLFVGVVPFCFSLATVGAYRIRPDVSEDEMVAVNKASLFNGRVRRFEGVCDTPLQFYRLFVRDSFFVGVVPFCFSLATVGAYCIRPDVGGNGMMAVNKTSSFNGRVRRRGGRMRYAPTFLLLIRWDSFFVG